jgi:hypothetical protein
LKGERHSWEPASGGEARALGSFLRLLEIDAADAARHPDAFDRIRSDELHGVIVHEVYSPGVLAGVVERLERHDPAFLQTRFPEPFRSWFYGRNLNLSHPDLPGYFSEADTFHAQLASLFPAGLGIAEHVARILAALDRGRPFLSAPGPHPDQRYMFTTLRAHLEGGFIPPHFDNEQALRPSYRHLRSLVELHMLSFVLALAQPEGGGALEVFDLRCEPQDASILSDDRVQAKPDVSAVDSVSFRLPAGTMIVLDSGRYLHRLTPVQGVRKRWTACSFMALSRARDAMYCWG